MRYGTKKDEVELATADTIDTIRTVVRLRHRMQMRRELNEIEAIQMKRLRDAVNNGQPFAFSGAELLKDYNV